MRRSPEGPVFDPRARSKGLVTAAFWAIVCLLAFLWWASTYTSFVEWLGEWEFAHFGVYFPAATVVACVALLAAPALLIVLHRRRRLRRRAEAARTPTGAERAAVAINAAERGRAFFLTLAAISALCALGALVSLLLLPDPRRALTTIDRATALRPVAGPARFAPGRSIGRVALLREDVGLVQRVIYVAPVTLNGEAGQRTRFFTEVERLASPSPDPRFAPIPHGMLQADGVPRELVNLYRGAGLAVADRPYLLVADVARLRWRPLVLAAQLGLLALVAGIGSLLLRRQARRLRRRAARGEAG